MKLTFTQEELEAIIRLRIKNNVSFADASDCKITFTIENDSIVTTANLPYLEVTGIDLHVRTGVAPPPTHVPQNAGPVIALDNPPVIKRGPGRPPKNSNPFQGLTGNSTPTPAAKTPLLTAVQEKLDQTEIEYPEANAVDPIDLNQIEEGTVSDSTESLQETRPETEQPDRDAVPAKTRGPSLFSSFLS